MILLYLFIIIGTVILGWLGKVLNSKFNTKEKVTDLIDGGDISCAWSDSDWDRNDIETNRLLYYMQAW